MAPTRYNRLHHRRPSSAPIPSSIHPNKKPRRPRLQPYRLIACSRSRWGSSIPVVRIPFPTMTVPSVRLYVDVVSPFAYEAFHILRVRRDSRGFTLASSSVDGIEGNWPADGQVQHDAAFGNVECQVVPIFLGGLMHAVCIVLSVPARRVDVADGISVSLFARVCSAATRRPSTSRVGPSCMARSAVAILALTRRRQGQVDRTGAPSLGTRLRCTHV